ncbi:hypothetical protein I6M49_22220 [Shewanella algae]|uniref:hypothetical protein n=1 Tax=Shewanella algae TaxID=38313 RepID=UPI001AACD13A|nr:hypothetical protein [Shewanella algae]MBO2656162.1 hypothetical protein [Shewanella algae]
MIKQPCKAALWLSGILFTLQANANLDLEQAAKLKESEAKIQSSFSDEIKTMMDSLGDIEVVKMLPIKNVMLIQLKDKPPMFISSNGRFLIDGDIKDLWAMQQVKTAEQADATWLLHLDKFGDGKLMEKLAVIPFGNQNLPKQARVFVSPTASESQAFIKELDPSKVNLDLIIMPHQKGAITPALKAWCGYSTTDSIQILMSGETEGVAQRDCSEEDLKRVMTPMLMAVYLDIDKVPYFVRIDGKRVAGVPKKYLEWLENSPKDEAQEPNESDDNGEKSATTTEQAE